MNFVLKGIPVRSHSSIIAPLLALLIALGSLATVPAVSYGHTSPRTRAVTPGLVAAYSFNEGSGATVADSSGNGRTASLVGGPTWGLGQFGTALSFDGVDDYGEVTTFASLPALPAWTISAWVRSPVAPSYGVATGPLHREANFQLNWNHPDPTLRGAAAGNLGGTWYAASFGPLAADTWYFLAATYDGNTLNAYTNGILVTSNPTPAGPAPADPNPLSFGKHAADAPFFRGTVDEIRIYDHALSAAEIRSDMNTPIGGPSADPTPPTVALTTPASGATVSGTITVSANASDNVGVAGVQFLLDGASLGAEVTRAPYSLPWNTATSANGSHVLSAVARDAAGNRTTVNPVTVTVSNSAGEPSLIGQWSAPFATPALAVHTVLLRTGDVLMWDAFDNGHEAYLWSSTTGAFTYVPSASNIFCAAPTLLANGLALVVGGHTLGGVGIPDANLFDPVSKSWIHAAPMAFPRWYPTATTLPDGRVLVVSGSTSCFTCVADIPEVYDPTTNTWTQWTNARLSMPLYPHLFVLPDGRILYASSTEGATTTQALDLGTQTWTMIDPVPVPGGSSAMYRPGMILKSGSPGAPGRIPPEPSLDTSYVLDMNQPSPAWRAVGRMAFPRTYHTLTILPDGNVLTTSGSQGNDPGTTPVYAAELWSPQTEAWTTMANAQMARTYHQTALLLPDGRVLVSGSGGCCGAPDQPNAEIFSPPYLFRGPRPSITSAPATVTYGSSVFVGTPDAGTIGSVVLIRSGAATHQFDFSQNYVPLSFTRTANGLNVQMPANANLARPGDYMLFVVSTNGIPSTASLIRVSFTTQDREPPTPPANLAATGELGQVSLTWTAATDNVGVLHYNVHRSTSPGFTPSPANRIAQPMATSYTDSGLGAGTYDYVVIAQDFAGNVGPPSNQAVATVTPGIAGLVAAYRFDEGGGTTAADASGNGRTLSLVGGPTWVPGRFGSALSFDGVNGYGKVTTFPPLPTLPAWTISAWVRSPAAPSSGAATGPLHREANFQLNWDHPDPAFRGAAAGNLGGTWSAASFGPLAADTWYFLAATYDGDTLNAYTNGVLVTSNRAPSGPAATDPNPLTFGKHAAAAQFFRGSVDEVRIYDRALSAAQIQSDMNTPVGGTPTADTTPPTSPANLAATAAGSSQINLAWTASTDTVGVVGYQVERCQGAGCTAFVLVASPAGTTYSDTGLSAATSYSYRARARDAANNLSTFSNVATATTAPSSGTTGLVAAYSFNEGSGTTAADASGNGRTASLLGGPTWVPGQFGNALSFDGVNDHGVVSTFPTLPAWTISAWVRSPAAPQNRPASGPLHREANFRLNWDHPNATFRAGAALSVGGPWYAASFGSLAANTWYFLAATYDGETLRAYKNAVLVTSDATPSGPAASDPSPLTFGKHAVAAQFFQGTLDEVRIYNGVLTAAEIQRDMQTPIGGTPPATALEKIAGSPSPADIGQWSGPFSWPLVAAHMTLMPSGAVLAWDEHADNRGAWLWDPANGTFSPAPSDARNLSCSPTAVTLPDGRVLVVSGGSDCPTCIADIPEVYDPATNLWTQLPNAKLALPLSPHLFALPDGRVLAASAQAEPIASTVLDLDAQTWTTVDPTVVDGGSSAMYLPGHIIKSGTARSPDAPHAPSVANTYVLDMTRPSPAWRETSPMGFSRTQHNLTLLPDGDVLATGGSETSNVFDPSAVVYEAELWSPTTETWTTMARMQVPRLYHSTALLLPDGRVLAAGGGGFGVDQPSAEIYSPRYLFKGPRPVITSAPTTILLGAPFVLKTPDASRIASVSLVRPGSVTHAFNQDQRFIPLAFRHTADGLTVEAPDSPNLAPPGYYMLFIVDADEVPSVASFVRLQ